MFVFKNIVFEWTFVRFGVVHCVSLAVITQGVTNVKVILTGVVTQVVVVGAGLGEPTLRVLFAWFGGKTESV